MPVTIAPATEEDLGDLLPSIASYQRFYGMAAPDDERNRAFFSRFLDGAPEDRGLILLARDEETGAPLGHATLYWFFSSTDPADVVVLNDLFVTEDARGKSVGRELLEAAADVARGRGAKKLTWMTAPDNETAQRLYDTTGAERSSWYEYELDV